MAGDVYFRHTPPQRAIFRCLLSMLYAAPFTRFASVFLALHDTSLLLR